MSADDFYEEIVECPECEGLGWVADVAHSRRCAEVGDCVCEGEQIRAECSYCRGLGEVSA